MPIYEPASAEVFDRTEKLLEKYHGGLRDAGVKLDILFASPRPDSGGEINPESNPVKLHGYPCAAIVKVNSYKLRVQNHGDAEIIIDKDKWEFLSDAERDALLDHELEHIELKTDKDGGVLRDDLDRPKLRVRLHDLQWGFFHSIARRHGRASLEVQTMSNFLESEIKQLYLFDDSAKVKKSRKGQKELADTWSE